MKSHLPLLKFFVFIPLTFGVCEIGAIPSLPTLKFPLGVSLEYFDPTEAEDFISIRILENLGRGLMDLDNNLKAIPGLAENYKVSKDKLTYTFKIEKALWSDGKPLTGKDFAEGFKRTFSPSTKAKISQNLQDIIVGAKDFKSGKITDFTLVGVASPSEDIFEIKLVRPAPYLLSLLALPFAFPQRENLNSFQIKKQSPTIGAYFISDFKSGSNITLAPNPYSNLKPKNKVKLIFIQDSTTAMSLYEKNEIDVLEKIPSTDFDRFKKSPELVTAPFLATYYLGFNIAKKPYDSLEVRKTLLSAIKRSELAKIFKDPQNIASSWVPRPFETSDENFVFNLSEPEKKKALAILKDYTLEIDFDAQDKNTLIISYVQDQIEKNLNIHLNLKSFEWKSFLSYLQTDSPGLFRFAWLAAFPDALSHLAVFTSGNPNNHTGFTNKRYDELVSKISQTPPYSKARINLIRQAQNILLVDQAVIYPLYHYVQYTLIKSKWQGLELTPMGLLHFYKANLKHEP